MQHSFNDWDIVEKLGEGGMCAVYRARRGEEERAIKVLLDNDPELRKRFLTEARVLEALDHPNVVSVHAWVEDDPPWLVMDLLGGRDLAHHRDGRAADPEHVARWIADAASGLAAVHDAGLVHRDVKPANLMLGDDGVVRLIDFGIARETAEAHQTAKGLVMGTASYLAPELFATNNPQDLQDQAVAEVYSLGQTLCELLIGRPIYAESEAHGVMLARLMAEKVERDHLDPREWNPSVPNGLAAVVMDATEIDPERRIPSAAAFEERLRKWLYERAKTVAAPVSQVTTFSTVPNPPAPVMQVEPKPGHWMHAGAAGAALVVNTGLVLVTLAVLAGLWLLRPRPSALHEQISADPRVHNCVSAPSRFEVFGTGEGVRVEGLPNDEAACIGVLGWRGASGTHASVEVH